MLGAVRPLELSHIRSDPLRNKEHSFFGQIGTADGGLAHQNRNRTFSNVHQRDLSHVGKRDSALTYITFMTYITFITSLHAQGVCCRIKARRETSATEPSRRLCAK
jgi:hypothetical protein